MAFKSKLHVQRSPLRRCANAAGVVLLSSLLGCSGEPASVDTAPSQSMPAQANADHAVEDSATIRAADLARRGDLALRDQRLFLPPADNAFELFLLAAELDRDNSLARTALDDLMPYAVLHVEQRVAATDFVDAERVLAQIARAAPDAPALPRLQNLLQSAQTSALARANALQAAAAVSVATAPEPPPVAEQVPPAAPTAVEAIAPPTEQVPEAAAPAPAVASARPTPSPIVAPERSPEVLFRPALRYPPLAQRRRIEGRVELEFLIGIDGSVSDVSVLSSEPEGIFDREAIGALQRWRFEPPASPMRAKRALEFKLDN